MSAQPRIGWQTVRAHPHDVFAEWRAGLFALGRGAHGAKEIIEPEPHGVASRSFEQPVTESLAPVIGSDAGFHERGRRRLPVVLEVMKGPLKDGVQSANGQIVVAA